MGIKNNGCDKSETQNLIETYLWFRYLPPNEFPEWLDSCLGPDTKGENYSIKETSDRIDLLFDKLLSVNRSSNHIVPISGGWDSRFILAALLERLNTEQITTLSFGSKGQLDYELGKKIAETVDVRHYQIDLKEFDFDWQSITESVRRSPWTYVPDEMFNFLSQKSVASKGDIIWSGFLGDHLAGSHITEWNGLNKQIEKFLNRSVGAKFVRLVRDEFDPVEQLPNLPHQSKLNWDDALEIAIRQAHGIAPVVLPIKEWENWEPYVGTTLFGSYTVAPFVDKNWAGYWLSAPRGVRKNQSLFLETLNTKYPKLFSIPDKTDFGISGKKYLRKKIIKKTELYKKRIQKKFPWMGIRSIKMLNYLDYDEMFREDKRYQETILYALELLKNDYPIDWLNLDKIWDDHYKRKEEYGMVLLILLGLSANLEINFNGQE